MQMQTYNVWVTAGAHNLFFGDDLVDGYPITYPSTVPSGTTVFFDPHGPGMYRLFWTHAATASGAHTNILPSNHTEITPGSGIIKAGAAGAAANYGRQVAWFRTMPNPGDLSGPNA